MYICQVTGVYLSGNMYISVRLQLYIYQVTGVELLGNRCISVR